MSKEMGRPYVSLGKSDRPPQDEHHDAVQLLVTDVLRKFTGTLMRAVADASSAHELIAAQAVMEKAYFTSLHGKLRLMGQQEAAVALGMTRQWVGQLEKGNPNFPRPVARLACGPVWLAEDIEQFARMSRRPGPPVSGKKAGK
jgi:hypothetical protein